MNISLIYQIFRFSPNYNFYKYCFEPNWNNKLIFTNIFTWLFNNIQIHAIYQKCTLLKYIVSNIVMIIWPARNPNNHDQKRSHTCTSQCVRAKISSFGVRQSVRAVVLTDKLPWKCIKLVQKCSVSTIIELISLEILWI